MKCLRHPFLIFGLVGCLLLVGGIFASQSSAHSLHHVHHKSATHATLICSWFCAAGEILEVSVSIFLKPSSFVIEVGNSQSLPVCTTSTLFVFKRGPPSFNV